MAKDKQLKTESNPSKRKKLSSIASEVCVEEMMDTEVKKKRKKIEVQVISTVICTHICFR